MPPFAAISLIALGGAAGAICRYLVTLSLGTASDTGPRFPWGVLAANLAGCLLIGVLAAVLMSRSADDCIRFLLITGFLGSFTTFSAFGLDTFELLKANAMGLALANIAASVVGGIALAAIGWTVTQRLIGS